LLLDGIGCGCNSFLLVDKAGHRTQELSRVEKLMMVRLDWIQDTPIAQARLKN
jgi:hypothetical protein